MENNPKRNAEYYPDPTAYQAIRNVEPQRFPFMPVVYVCSPYAGDVEENIRKACACCRYTVDQGCIPLAPHLYLPRFLDEESERGHYLWISHYCPAASNSGSLVM